MSRFDDIERAAASVFGLPVSSYERNIVSRVYDEVEAAIEYRTESDLLEYIESAVVQACGDADGILDSSSISVWADGIKLLERHGRATIMYAYGRNVRAVLNGPDAQTGEGPSDGDER